MTKHQVVRRETIIGNDRFVIEGTDVTEVETKIRQIEAIHRVSATTALLIADGLRWLWVSKKAVPILASFRWNASRASRSPF